MREVRDRVSRGSNRARPPTDLSGSGVDTEDGLRGTCLGLRVAAHRLERPAHAVSIRLAARPTQAVPVELQPPGRGQGEGLGHVAAVASGLDVVAPNVE